jgi:hemerythrin superfamily protein
MTTHTGRQVDIVELLLDDHRVVRHLLERFDAAMGVEGRQGLFRQLTTALVQHEVAEEVTVYPVVRQLGEAGADEADTRIREQAEAEEVLQAMARLDVMGDTFIEQFQELREAVLRHAEAEETMVFPYLTGATTPEDRMEMARRYERAVESAPTHPHPHAPDTPPGNRIAGPVAALGDRVRDAFRSPDGER